MTRLVVAIAGVLLATMATSPARAGVAEICSVPEFGDPKVFQTARQVALACRELADQGDVRAELNLGWLYNIGSGVRQDYGEAARWWRKAADRGNAIAQTALGYLYA